MKEKTCCFSGHRNILKKEYAAIKKALYKEIKNLIEDGVIYFGCGGALGFDTIAAETVLNLKKKYPYIKLIMVYPCETQTALWSKEQIEKYNTIKLSCDKYVYTSKSYHKSCMHKRNRHLVDNSSYCICYLKLKTGGTAFTVNYARQNKLKIINIADIINSS